MPPSDVRKDIVARARRIVVKVGTSAITDPDGRLERPTVTALAGQLAALMRAGKDVILVASGAVGAGMGELNLPQRPKSLPMLQAVAAVGQGQLMRVFHDVFARRRIRVAQVLVTRDDFENRTRYLNIRNTLHTLWECGVLPVLNENDAVAVDELRFGDNDIIAAHLTNMLAADVLVLLSTVDGLLDGGRIVDVVSAVDDQARALADGRRSRLGSGGMASKLSAAELVTRAGEVAVIANARAPRVLLRLLKGQAVGTVFVPAAGKMSSRRRWIAQASRPAGRIHVDAGAARALRSGGKSLLPSGIAAVSGRFQKGDTVIVAGPDGRELARGLTNYDAGQVEKIKGLRTAQVARVLGEKPYDEVIHRNNMTLS
jgi:glutamate 5-kinase